MVADVTIHGKTLNNIDMQIEDVLSVAGSHNLRFTCSVTFNIEATLLSCLRETGVCIEVQDVRLKFMSILPSTTDKIKIKCDILSEHAGVVNLTRKFRDSSLLEKVAPVGYTRRGERKQDDEGLKQKISDLVDDIAIVGECPFSFL